MKDDELGQYIDQQVEEYVNRVIDGEEIACQLVVQCCQRYRDDRLHGEERGIRFCIDKAVRVVKFFSNLKHSKGEWAGKTFELSLWQVFILWNLFGFYGPGDHRRFKTAYIECARKNGKSTFLAGIGLYLFVADKEPGAEVYTAATKRDQAVITHGEATRMVRSSPKLRKIVSIFRNNLNIEDTAAKFEPLGRDSDSCDGLNVHGAIVDELHAHKTRDMWDVLETATGSRRQPLQIAITTAGYDQSGVCFEQRLYVEKILKGVIEDDSYFGIIFTVDPEDDWHDENVWMKANPNLGVSVKWDDLQRKARKAHEIPAAQNSFLRKHLDIWTQQSDRWISLDLWDLNNLGDVSEEKLKGRMSFGGLDLSSVSDLTAWVQLFPRNGFPKDGDDAEIVDVLCRVWCPEERLYDSQNRYREQYQAWHRSGFLFTTPGNAIDYGVVRAQVLVDAKKFNLVSMSVDRLFQGYQVAMEIGEELGAEKVVAMGMGYLSMAGPMNELEGKLLKHHMNHGGHPILRWMADNLAVSEDAAGNRKPNKAESQGKIDGIVGILLALDRYMRFRGVGESVYVKQGLKVL